MHTLVRTLMRRAGLERFEQTAQARFPLLVGLVLALALTARVCSAVLWADINPTTANLWEYGSIAAASIKHGAIVGEIIRPDGSVFVYPTALMPPMPIFLWMGLFWLFGITKTALAAMIAINIVCGTAVTFYTIRIARHLFHSPLLALAAGLIMAVHPVFVFSAATYHAVNLYGVLLLALFDLSSSPQRPTLARAVLVGALLGIAALTRTEDLALGGAVVLGSLLTHRRIGLSIASIVVAIALITPWTIRNYVVFERFVPVADSLGYNLFKGFNPLANGSGHWVDQQRLAQQLLGEQASQLPQDAHLEADLDTMYRRYALHAIAQDPVRAFVILPVRKVLLFWFFDIYDPNTHRLAYQIPFWIVLVLSVIGIGQAVRSGLLRDPAHRTVAIVFATETLVMAAYAVHARYRMNVEPFLFAYATLGGLILLARIRNQVTSAPDRSRELAQPATATPPN